jgi:hypothetical protein
LQSHNRVLVTRAGGLHCRHLVAEFRKQGYQQMRPVDLKPAGEWCQRFRD